MTFLRPERIFETPLMATHSLSPPPAFCSVSDLGLVGERSNKKSVPFVGIEDPLPEQRALNLLYPSEETRGNRSAS